MSKMFSKAERFKKKGSETPAPGAYDVSVGGKFSGPISFDKSTRFKMDTSADTGSDDSLVNTTQHTQYKPPRGRPSTSSSKKRPQEGGDSAAIIGQLEEQIRKLTQTCSDLTEQLTTAGQRNTALQERLDSELQEKCSLHEELLMLKRTTMALEEGRELEATVNRLRGEVSTLTNGNVCLQQELDTVRAACQSSDGQLVELGGELSSRRTECEQLKAQLDDERAKLLADLTKQELLASKMSSTNNQLQDKIQTLDDQIATLTSENAALQQSLGSTRQKLAHSREMIAEQQSAHHVALEALTNKCLAFEEEAALQRQSRRDEESVLKLQLSGMGEANRRLENENQTTLRILTTKESELEELREQLLSATTAHKEELRTTNDAWEALLTEKRSLEEQLQSSRDAFNVLEKEKEAIESELLRERQTSQENHSFRTRKEEDIRKISELETELQKQRQEREESESMWQTKLEEAQGKNRTLKDELGATKTELLTILSSAESELKRLKSTSDDDEGTDSGMRLDDSLNDTDVKRLSSDLAARIAELEAEIKRLKLENEDLKRAYSELEEKYAPYQDTIDRLEDENKLLRSQTAMAQQEAKRLSEQYAKLLGHQNQRQKIMHVKNLKDENAALKQEVTKLKNEITRHKRTIHRLEEEAGNTSSRTRPLISRN